MFVNELSSSFEDIFQIISSAFAKVLVLSNAWSFLLKPAKNTLITMSLLEHYWPKAFDCVNHKLLIAILHVYGLDNSSLSLIHSYLNNRQQRVRVDNEFSTWSDIKDGVLQRSILGPLFFNIHICDLFYIIQKWPIANYAYDTTPYTGVKNTQDVTTSLENCALVLFKWFENDLMKANSAKSHLLLVPLQTKWRYHEKFWIWKTSWSRDRL